MSKFLAEIRDGCDGGAEEDRTPDLCSAIEVDGTTNGGLAPFNAAIAAEREANMARTSATCTGATPDTILADLARVKVIFQLRTIAMAIGAPR